VVLTERLTVNRSIRAGLVAAIACLTVLASAPAAFASAPEPPHGGGGTVRPMTSVATPHAPIRTLMPGKCASVDITTAPYPVVFRECTGNYAPSQGWTESAGQLVSDQGNTCLTGDTYAAQLYTAECVGATNQQWHYVGDTLRSYSGWCVDDPYASLAQGVRLQLNSCNGNDAQTFSEPGGPIGPGSYSFNSIIQAESYSYQYGTGVVSDPGGTRYVGYITNGDWVQYDNVSFLNLGAPAPAYIDMTIASPIAGSVYVYVDSADNTPAIILPLTARGNWLSFITYNHLSLGSLSGDHTLLFRFSTSTGYDFANFDWFQVHA
jgi:hypothetical protein